MTTTRPNNRAIVREAIRNMNNGETFSTASLASRLKLSVKDVSNVVHPMLKMNALERKTDKGGYVYTIDSNLASLYFAKYPFGYKPDPTKPGKTRAAAALLANSKRRKNRSPLAIAIDSEIAELEVSIKKLKAFRREYAS